MNEEYLASTLFQLPHMQPNDAFLGPRGEFLRNFWKAWSRSTLNASFHHEDWYVRYNAYYAKIQEIWYLPEMHAGTSPPVLVPRFTNIAMVLWCPKCHQSVIGISRPVSSSFVLSSCIAPGNGEVCSIVPSRTITPRRRHLKGVATPSRS